MLVILMFVIVVFIVYIGDNDTCIYIHVSLLLGVSNFGMMYRISPSISREIYPRTKYYTDNSSYTRVTPSGKKLYQKQVEFSVCILFLKIWRAGAVVQR